MKKALLGLTGALLATSAFTAANAAVIATDHLVANAYTATTAVEQYAAENIPAVDTVLGTAAAQTDINIAFASQIGGGGAAANFALRINVTGAKFNTPATWTATPLRTNGAAHGQATCSAFAQSATQLVFTCSNPANPADGAVQAVRLQPAANANTWLSTAAGGAGTNIQIDAKVSPDTNFLSDVEAPASATTVARIIDGFLSRFAAAPSTVVIQQTQAGFATDFSSFTAAAPGTSTAGVVQTLTVGPANTVVLLANGNAFDEAAAETAATTAVLTITSPIIGQTAVTGVTIGAPLNLTVTKTGTPAAFSGDTFTLTLSDTQVNTLIAAAQNATTPPAGIPITANLSGTNTIAITNASAGTISFDVALGAGFIDEPAGTGATAVFSRGGFTAHFNNFYTLTSAYESFVRIVNPTGSAGTATLRIWDAGTGALVCTATTPSIAGQSSLEASRATIVALCGAQLPAVLPTYLNAEVSGAFAGYAQHVVWNNRTTVTDLSGRRL